MFLHNLSFLSRIQTARRNLEGRIEGRKKKNEIIYGDNS